MKLPSLYVAHFNLCGVHEAHRQTPAIAIGIVDHPWSISELIDAAPAQVPPGLGHRHKKPSLTVIEGGNYEIFTGRWRTMPHARVLQNYDRKHHDIWNRRPPLAILGDC
jgi:hypothetical protein